MKAWRAESKSSATKSKFAKQLNGRKFLRRKGHSARGEAYLSTKVLFCRELESSLGVPGGLAGRSCRKCQLIDYSCIRFADMTVGH